MVDPKEWFEKIYAGEDTSGWLVSSPEEAAKLVDGKTGRQFRSTLHMACCYSSTGPEFCMALPNADERWAAAFAAWMLGYYDRREDALDLLANGLLDSEGLRDAYDLSFRFTAEGGHDA